MLCFWSPEGPAATYGPQGRNVGGSSSGTKRAFATLCDKIFAVHSALGRIAFHLRLECALRPLPSFGCPTNADVLFWDGSRSMQLALLQPALHVMYSYATFARNQLEVRQAPRRLYELVDSRSRERAIWWSTSFPHSAQIELEKISHVVNANLSCNCPTEDCRSTGSVIPGTPIGPRRLACGQKYRS